MAAHIFHDYWDAGVREVIPVIPPGAVIDREYGSHVSDSQRGKIPGKYKPGVGKWVGFDGWNEIEITDAMIRTWDTWPAANVGLRSMLYPATDFDVEHAELASSYYVLAKEFWGDILVRGREGSSRLLMPFRLNGDAKGKNRIVFTHPSIPGSNGSPGAAAVEFLGNGQQYLVHGIHPSGKPYRWYRDLDILKWLLTAEDLPVTTPARWLEWQGATAEWIEEQGGTITHASTSTATDGDDRPIGDESLRAWDREKLVSALGAIPCAKLDYAEWERVLRAAKGAAGGDHAFLEEILIPWCHSYPDNDDNVIRAKWDSHTTSTIGALWLYAKAREYGWQGTPEAFEPVEESESEEAAMFRQRNKAPTIRMQPGNFDLTVQDAENALVAANDGIYSYGNRLVRPAKAEIIAADNRRDSGTRLIDLKAHHLRERLTFAGRFQRFDRREGKWTNADCPQTIADTLLEHGTWSFPLLVGFTNTPLLRPDGTILSTPGYDAETGLLFVESGLVYPAVSDQPSFDDALQALSVLKTLISKMDYVSDADRSVALSAILSALARRAVPLIPLPTCPAIQDQLKHGP